MSTTLTPPPAEPQAAAPTPTGPRTSSVVVAIVFVVVGALIILGSIASAVFTTVRSATVTTGTATADVRGVTQLDVDLSAGVLSVEFADVDDAQLEVVSSAGISRWKLERDGDTLVIASPDPTWNFPGGFGGVARAVLTLPEPLAGVDADLQMSAGQLIVDGALGALDLNVGAGDAQVRGSATSATVQVSAGHAVLDLADVQTGDFTVSVGSIEARLTGEQPRAITAEVSAGGLDLAVPDGTYAVKTDVAAGDVTNLLDASPRAANTIDVRVSAGHATLRTAR